MSKIICKIKDYKGILKDVILNLFSNILITSIIQILIFPLIARKAGNIEFGYIISIYGINNVIVIFLGNTLNNVRLLNQKEKVNYSMIALIVNILSLLTIIAFTFFYRSQISVVNLTIFALFTLLANNRAYISVFYRIKLEYNKILYLNFMIIFGYGIGILIYIFSDLWTLIFFSGELFGLFYMIITRNQILSEFLNLNTKRLNLNIVKQFTSLSFSNALSSILNYLDRFIIVPILGAYSMAIFYAASSVSKILTMIITPMTNVMLSHITQSSKRVGRKKLLKIYFLLLLLAVPIYFILNVFSVLIVNVLYPTMSNDAKLIIPLVSVGILVNTICSMLNPFMLQMYRIIYQVVIQLAYGIVYILCAILLGNKFGLIGFTFGYTIAMLTKLVFQIGVTSFGRYK